MNAWLGIHGYSLKDAMLNAVASVASNLQLSQRVGGHKSMTNTMRYTHLTAIGDNLKVTSKLVIPGLHPRFGDYNEEQVLNYLNSMVI